MTAPEALEEVIEPGLPIIDPHHHLWHRHGHRYLLDELLADTGQADVHGARPNVRSTVFVECASMYRADGPEALRPVGETEFVDGIAAMSASGGDGGEQIRNSHSDPIEHLLLDASSAKASRSWRASG